MRANLAALSTLRQLRSSGRAATGAEQAVLARWSSWGAVPGIFEETKDEWDGDREQLRELLDEGEYAAARRTTINAHYTDPAYAREMWAVLGELGITSGRVLEPGCGAGVFMGTAPEGVSVTGVELDPITAAIATHLHPGHQVRGESFADTTIPRGYFDAAIGNVPFGNVRLHDPSHNPTSESLHNHFILKSLDLVRPGGVVVVLTSSFTMDARNPGARILMGERADLLGAVRLPTGAHRRAAGTEALTDVLILRRRAEDHEPADVSWYRTTAIEVDGHQIRTNAYFVEHPEMVLGRYGVGHGMYGSETLHVRAADGQDTTAGLRGALTAVVDHARRAGLLAGPVDADPSVGRGPVLAAPGTTRWDGHIFVDDEDRFTTVRDGLVEEIEVPQSQRAELRGLLDIRTRTVDLLTAEATTLDDTADLDERRAGLNRSYEQYVRVYGPISRVTVTERAPDPQTGEARQIRRRPPVMRVFRGDPFAQTVLALGTYDESTGQAVKADIFRGRVVVPRVAAIGADTAADAMALCLDAHGRIEIETIADLLGVDAAEARGQLGDLVYADPGDQGRLVPATEYLSGNVVAKLDVAAAVAEEDPAYAANVTALERVVPAPLGPGQIEAKMGAVWIPASTHEEFLSELLDEHVRVKSPGQGIWDVSGRGVSVASTSTWGTARRPAHKIAEAVLEQRALIVKDYDSDGGSWVNAEESAAAQEKADLMRERFSEWVWENPQRSVMLADRYNRAFNATVLRDFTAEGEALSLPGLAKTFTPRPHQRTATARMIHDPAVGLFHEVGAGKTSAMVMGAMELKRLGLVSKPVVVVPNHMLDQFSSEWLQIYPRARLLAAGSADLAGEGRREFVARAAVNDWDGIIMTRGSFSRITLSAQAQADYLEAQMDITRQTLSAARTVDASPATVKQLEKSVLADEERHKKLLDAPKDPGLDFDQTGIDYVIVDEAHDYKNLHTPTHIQGAAIAGSQRASDLDMKLAYLRERHGARIGTLATGTPLTNSITEAYVMQRYMRPDVLEDAGIGSFDQWAATFGKTTTELEIAPQGGSFKLRTRFASFQNAPELLRMWGTFADVKNAAVLGLPRPDIAANRAGERVPEDVVIPAGDDLKAYMAGLGDRVDRIQARAVDPTEDNMLAVSTDGRKAAMDMRLVDASITVPDNPKAVPVADQVAAIWRAHKDDVFLGLDGEPSPTRGAVQLVFCDFSTPREEWNMYDEIKGQLVDRGVPAEGIRFIHEAKNDAEKARLFAQTKAGKVAVLLGSTSKMGTGTNVQSRVVAIHHVDCPWRPADLTQRDGRGIRQGNQNTEVGIYRYMTEGSFDAFMWQTVERKAASLDVVMSGNWDVRELEDITDTALSAGAAKAAASGDPLVLARAQAQQRLAKLQRLERAHHRDQASLLSTVDTCRTDIDTDGKLLPLLDEAIARLEPTKGDRFQGRFAGTPTDDRVTAQHRLHAAVAQARAGRPHRMAAVDLPGLAHIGGHDIDAHIRPDAANATEWLDLRIRGLPRSTMSVQIKDISADGHGLVTRLENHVVALPESLARARARIEKNTYTLGAAEEHLGTPFRHEVELGDVKAELADIEARMRPAEETPPPTPDVAPGQPRPQTTSRDRERGQALDAPTTASQAPPATTPGPGRVRVVARAVDLEPGHRQVDMAARLDALVQDVQTHRPGWARHLVDAPEDPVGAQRWRAQVRRIVAYRDRYAVTTDEPVPEEKSEGEQEIARAHAYDAYEATRCAEPAEGPSAGFEVERALRRTTTAKRVDDLLRRAQQAERTATLESIAERVRRLREDDQPPTRRPDDPTREPDRSGPQM